MVGLSVRNLGDWEDRTEEYWEWVAVALFLLITVDLLTSLFAAGVVGIEHEGNPLMAWALAQPLAVIIAVHVGAVVLAASGFWLLFDVIKQSAGRSRRFLHLATELYLGLLVAVGLFVFANNLAVIMLGRSLL